MFFFFIKNSDNGEQSVKKKTHDLGINKKHKWKLFFYYMRIEKFLLNSIPIQCIWKNFHVISSYKMSPRALWRFNVQKFLPIRNVSGIKMSSAKTRFVIEVLLQDSSASGTLCS